MRSPTRSKKILVFLLLVIPLLVWPLGASGKDKIKIGAAISLSGP